MKKGDIMHCPVCGTTILSYKQLDEGLEAKECSTCGGHWISSSDYWDWLDKHGETLPEKSFSDILFDIKDLDKAILCPDCGHILLKFKVGHGIDFFLDHCNSCNGVWLDKNEWNALKDRNLHDEIHRIFTTSWQKQIRKDELANRMEQIYLEKFGNEDYEKVKKIKKWLDSHPRRSTLLAYLNDPNPYIM